MNNNVLWVTYCFLTILCTVGAHPSDDTTWNMNSRVHDSRVYKYEELPPSTVLDDATIAVKLYSRSQMAQPNLNQTSRRHAHVSASLWKNIRITTSTNDVTNPAKYCSAVGQSRPNFLGATATCTENDILTDAIRSSFLNDILPVAVARHASRLLVEPLTTPLPIANPSTISVCQQFAIPSSDISFGVNNSDFVLYVATPIVDSFTRAWGRACAQLDSTGRPTYGVIAISPKFLQVYQYSVTLLTKTILQALGFALYFFRMSNMIQYSTLIRGRTGNFTTINSSTVVRQAIQHFNCEAIQSVELDVNGADNLTNLTWKGRVLHSDIITPGSVFGYYSAITLAAMEDLGYYRANYNAAEMLPWGHNAGCPFLTSKCVSLNVTSYGQFFCTNTAPSICSTDRSGIGLCWVIRYNSLLPLAYQYFFLPTVGGVSQTMDYCPVGIAMDNQLCTDQNMKTIPGSVASPLSRCFDVKNFPLLYENYPLNGICAEVQCRNDGRPLYQIKVQGASAFVNCPEGTTYNLSDLSSSFTAGTLTCANYSEICHQNLTVHVIARNTTYK